MTHSDKLIITFCFLLITDSVNFLSWICDTCCFWTHQRRCIFKLLFKNKTVLYCKFVTKLTVAVQWKRLTLLFKINNLLGTECTSSTYTGMSHWHFIEVLFYIFESQPVARIRIFLVYWNSINFSISIHCSSQITVLVVTSSFRGVCFLTKLGQYLCYSYSTPLMMQPPVSLSLSLLYISPTSFLPAC